MVYILLQVCQLKNIGDRFIKNRLHALIVQNMAATTTAIAITHP
ncbi:hypothetical protein [Calothrix sp. PCC 7507]|nr:hypothetical protein [Calothrix sp. PCC 7507]